MKELDANYTFTLSSWNIVGCVDFQLIARLIIKYF